MSEIDGSQQFGRKLSLIVFGRDLDGLDLSELRIKFCVKTSINQTPNVADIRIYNLSEETALQVQKEFKKVILQAGYAANYGVIFRGNIKQVILGRESATDTFIDIIAGDGDQAYNFAIVNSTIAAGSTIQDQVQAVLQPMKANGVEAGHLGDSPPEKLARAKSFYGPAKKYLRDIGNSTEQQWSIQNEKLTFVPNRAFLPGEIISINSSNGQVGTPQQTNDGVNVKCLLNPLINVGKRIKLDNKSIERQKLNLEQISAASASAAKGDMSGINNAFVRPLNSDGTYMPYVIEHSGDTRGVDWYTSMICITTDASVNPRNAVTGG